MKYIRDNKRRILQVLSLPLIWSVLIPMVIFDLWMEIYHRIGFSMYGIKYVNRNSYVKIDRHKLRYLKWYQRLACAYCGYANGLAAYWVEIASRTEIYWCGIMHRKARGFKTPGHHKVFAKYGNQKDFYKKYGKA